MSGIYVASRASLSERGAMWRDLRAKGAPIISTWIDETGEGETEDFGELWTRIMREIAAAHVLVFYAETGDFPLKGALIEVGAALALGKPVIVCLPGVVLEGRTHRPLGSWIEHPLVMREDRIDAAISEAKHTHAYGLMNERGED